MKLIVLGVLAIIIVGYTAYTMFGNTSVTGLFATSRKTESVQREPIIKAKELYSQKKKDNVDFDQSPCLSDDVGGGYSLDIVHNPRLLIDDQNTCRAYDEGQTQHLIEMTPDGTIVSIK